MSPNDSSNDAKQRADLSLGIAENLRDEILSGEHPPGARLPSETALAKRFGVSRPTLREALQRLAAQGFIETRRGARGGAFVANGNSSGLSAPMAQLLSLAALRDGLGPGAMLAGYVAALTAALDGGATAAMLEPALTALETAGPATLADAHLDFHLTLCAAAPNALTGLVARSFALAPATRLTPPSPSLTDCGRIAALCSRLAGAVRAGDAALLRRNLSDWRNFISPRSGTETGETA